MRCRGRDFLALYKTVWLRVNRIAWNDTWLTRLQSVGYSDCIKRANHQFKWAMNWNHENHGVIICCLDAFIIWIKPTPLWRNANTKFFFSWELNNSHGESRLPVLINACARLVLASCGQTVNLQGCAIITVSWHCVIHLYLRQNFCESHLRFLSSYRTFL